MPQTQVTEHECPVQKACLYFTGSSKRALTFTATGKNQKIIYLSQEKASTAHRSQFQGIQDSANSGERAWRVRIPPPRSENLGEPWPFIPSLEITLCPPREHGTQPHRHPPREAATLTEQRQDPADGPDHQGQAHAARVLEHALRRDEDSCSDDGADDDGDPSQQADFPLQHNFLLPRWLLAPRERQPRLNTALQVTPIGDGGCRRLSDHGSDPQGKKRRQSKRKKKN